MPDSRQTGPLPVIKGRYTCVGVLGQGAMARTLRAIDEETGQIVAVKMLYPSRLSSLKEFELFEREARTLARLAHRNIPRYLDHFDYTHEGERTYCLVQEHIDGPSLKKRIEEGERFDEAATIKLGIEVLEVLSYLGNFEPAVVHRDIKPSNLVTSPRGELAVVDFGAVREAVRQTLQCGSTVIGTYGYMPPEQLVGEARPASDVFALGVTLVHCLTRRPAAALSTDGFTIDLDELNLNISEPFRNVLKAMIATKLEERYTSADEALEDLRRVQSGQAPRYVNRIVRETEARRRKESREVRRRLQKGVTWVYRIAAGFAAAMLGVAIYLIVTQASIDLNAGLVTAAVVTAVGLLTAFFMLARRYIDDGWEPPPSTWRRETGEVIPHHFINDLQQSTYYHAYSFEVGKERKDGTRREVNGYMSGDKEILRNEYPIGTKLRVHYDPLEPEHHYIEVAEVDA